MPRTKAHTRARESSLLPHSLIASDVNREISSTQLHVQTPPALSVGTTSHGTLMADNHDPFDAQHCLSPREMEKSSLPLTHSMTLTLPPPTKPIKFDLHPHTDFSISLRHL